MSLSHANSGIKLNLLHPPTGAPANSTYAMIKTERMEVIRLVLAEGKELPDHKVTGEITLQCLEGRVLFKTNDLEQMLESGNWLYLEGDQVHSLKAESDAVLLLTVVFSC